METTNKKRAKVEDTFKKEIILLGKKTGWIIYSIADSRRVTAKGYPDLTIIHPEKKLLMGAELKTNVGKLTREQILWMTILSDYYPIHLWRPKHLDIIADMFKRGIVIGETQFKIERPSQCGETVDALALEASPVQGCGFESLH